MKWTATVTGWSSDIERLASDPVDDRLLRDDGNPDLLLIKLEIEDRQAATEADEGRLARAIANSIVRDVNGLGRLRWGRTFNEVGVRDLKSVDRDGQVCTHVEIGTAYDHMDPRDYADMVEEQGYPRPEVPRQVELVEQLDYQAASEIADEVPAVGRALHLVRLMLVGDEDIDWGAAYSALETVEHDLSERGLDARDLGWHSAREREDFTATANSVEVLGARARHGKPFGLTKPRTSAKKAGWYVRGLVAQWIAFLVVERENYPPLDPPGGD